MYETRVNLKHLLEDIRDSYSMPVEEVIVVELVANALDSKAKNISFYIDILENSLTIIDDGKGMRRDVLKDYHNIAATTKQRGEGIGFAGVGAKLSLLLAKQVLTETKGGHGSRAATLWHLTSKIRAPWKFTPFSGKVKTPRGTAVSIFLEKEGSPLLSHDFIVSVLQKYFLPLLLEEFHKKIFRFVYPKKISFFVEGEQVSPPEIFSHTLGLESFPIKFKGQRSHIAGWGILAKSQSGLPEELKGVAVSTYGKVIKRGWEWLGLDLGSGFLFGIVEMPCLAEVLTTNKSDFLQDQASLKKYYKWRKAIQESLLPVLGKLGVEMPLAQKQKSFSGLSKDIQKALFGLLPDFPEITALIGLKKSARGKKITEDSFPSVNIEPERNVESSQVGGGGVVGDKAKPEIVLDKSPSSKNRQKTKKSPKISIGFENNENTGILGRMIESTIWINKNHPAFLKASREGLEDYHILLSVAWVLAGFIEKEKSPLSFVSGFFSAWAKESQGSLLRLPKSSGF